MQKKKNLSKSRCDLTISICLSFLLQIILMAVLKIANWRNWIHIWVRTTTYCNKLLWQ